MSFKGIENFRAIVRCYSFALLTAVVLAVRILSGYGYMLFTNFSSFVYSK